MNEARRALETILVPEAGFHGGTLFRPDQLLIYSVMVLAELITPLLWPLSQRDLLSFFNSFQRLSTLDLLLALKRVEILSLLAFEARLKGGRQAASE
jgi:hypothetical protein